MVVIVTLYKLLDWPLWAQATTDDQVKWKIVYITTEENIS